MLKMLTKESFYCKKIQENSMMIIWSILLAAGCLLISYPGIFYSDSYGRIDTADKVRGSINLLLAGRRGEMPVIECWVTVIPSIFMAIGRMITGNIAAYTMAQCFSFFLVTNLLIKKIGSSYPYLQYIFMAINPLFYSMSVYYEAGVGCITAITVIVLVCTSDPKAKNMLDHVVEYILLVFASFVAFGYRANAFTVIPVILAYVLLQKWDAIRKAGVIMAVIMGLFLTILIPQILKIDTMGSGMAGFVWDMLTAIERMEPERKAEYMDYLDELGGEGSTARALEANSEFSVLGLMASDMNAYAISADGASRIILSKYVKFIIREPRAYFETKWMYAKKTLGIGERLLAEEYEYDLIERMWEWGYNNTNERLMFYRQYYALGSDLGWFILHPWKVFLVTAVLTGYSWRKKWHNREIHLLLLFLAVFYYGAFLINAQSFEFRYFYPSLYLMWIMDIGIILDFVRKGIKAIFLDSSEE